MNIKEKSHKYRSFILVSVFFIVLVAIGICTYSYHTYRYADRKAAESFLRQGQAYVDSNKIVPAIDCLQKAQAMFAEQEDIDKVFESSVYLALSYEIAGQHNEAYRTLKTVKYRDTPCKSTFSTQYYLRLSALYLLSIDKDTIGAERMSMKAIEYSRKTYPEKKKYEYVDIANLAELYVRTGQYAKARKALDKVRFILQPENKMCFAGIYNSKGMLAFFYDRDTVMSYRYFKKGLEYSQRFDAFDNALTALQMLARIDSINRDLPMYIKHRDAAEQIKEKLMGSETAYKIAIIREQHKTETLLKENEQHKTIYILSTFLSIAVAVALCVVAVWINQSANTRQKMARMKMEHLNSAMEREKMEKELMELKMKQSEAELIKTQNNNLAMSLKLAERDKNNGKDHIKPIDVLLGDLEENFIKKLQNRYPYLTQNDLRLACFIRKGLSTQEVAGMMNIAPLSLHKSRYRLKKKLNLNTSDDLDAFIHGL